MVTYILSAIGLAIILTIGVFLIRKWSFRIVNKKPFVKKDPPLAGYIFTKDASSLLEGTKIVVRLNEKAGPYYRTSVYGVIKYATHSDYKDKWITDNLPALIHTTDLAIFDKDYTHDYFDPPEVKVEPGNELGRNIKV